MNELEIRYDELEEAIISVRLQLEQCTDKYVKDILQECLDSLQDELDEIKDTVESNWNKEQSEQENEYERSAL